jgi:L-lactate dehydrogenase complex protein LldG
VEKTKMSERENILGRIREALKTVAPLPGAHDAGHAMALPQPPVAGARHWLPPVGDGFTNWVELFAKNAAELKADFLLFAGRDELRAALRSLRDMEKWQRVAAHKSELTDLAREALALPVCHTDGGYDVQELEQCDAGITECDALIAQTGSVLVTSRSAGGRALSVLPPHHVVLARREQLVPDLPAAFDLLKRKYAGKFPSMISFVTGPSRTGDIERILVLGAHGPRKLSVLCI